MDGAGFDLLAVGRSLLDLYSNDIGAPFPEIKSYSAYLGGSPANICVGARRLGLRTAMLSAVGDDLVGDFVLRSFEREGVETRFIPRKPGRRTSAAVVAIEPPEKTPLVYYRDNCADIELTIDDVLSAPLAASRLLLLSGTALSREPSRSASLFAAERARAAGATVCLGLDFRWDQWHDPRAYGVTMRSALRLVDLVIGTADEVRAAALRDGVTITVEHSQISHPRVSGDLAEAVEAVLTAGPRTLAVTRGREGATVYPCDGEPVEAAPFPVEICNTLGAGDAFSAGFLYGYLKGWDWHKAARMGNACGAIVVTRHGCANFMPYEKEALAFIAERGGF